MKIPKLEISHPLAHCEAAKAYHNGWAIECNAYPPGHRIREAALRKYRIHIGYIKHEDNCEICIEALKESNAKAKSMFKVQGRVTAK